MSIEQPDVIDFIGVNRWTGETILTISDHLDWSDTSAHLLLLQSKLNRYLAFVESGEIIESYPNAKGRPIVLKVIFKFRPNEEGWAFLEKAKPVVKSAGFVLREEVYTGARFS